MKTQNLRETIKIFPRTFDCTKKILFKKKDHKFGILEKQVLKFLQSLYALFPHDSLTLSRELGQQSSDDLGLPSREVGHLVHVVMSCFICGYCGRNSSPQKQMTKLSLQSPHYLLLYIIVFGTLPRAISERNKR